MPAGEFRVLAINPGSTSTKIAVYANDRAELKRNLDHAESEMEQFRGRPILDQLEFRQSRIEREFTDAGFPLERLQAVVGRGGLMRPLASGTYRVNEAMLEDLRWFGLEWSEGPDVGGPHGPYAQSVRMERYYAALAQLRAGNFIYPCACSRKDIQAAITAPHAADDELLYPGTCRNQVVADAGRPVNWRFRVPDGAEVTFVDHHFGGQKFTAGRDFADFVVWRADGVPAYQLACVVDDAAMRITEVVRGADLLVSTARQLLLYRALGLTPPEFFHCELVRDESGQRLAKRHDALSLRTLRKQGILAEVLRRNDSVPPPLGG